MKKKKTQRSAGPLTRVTDRVRRETEQRLAYYGAHTEEIDARLRELDEEWSLEKMLAAKVSAASLLGAAFGLLRSRLWFVLPLASSGFLLQHAVTGQCAPARLLRRWGARTAEEIHQERDALKALRGDFQDIKVKGNAQAKDAKVVFEAVRR